MKSKSKIPRYVRPKVGNFKSSSSDSFYSPDYNNNDENRPKSSISRIPRYKKLVHLTHRSIYYHLVSENSDRKLRQIIFNDKNFDIDNDRYFNRIFLLLNQGGHKSNFTRKMNTPARLKYIREERARHKNYGFIQKLEVIEEEAEVGMGIDEDYTADDIEQTKYGLIKDKRKIITKEDFRVGEDFQDGDKKDSLFEVIKEQRKVITKKNYAVDNQLPCCSKFPDADLVRYAEFKIVEENKSMIKNYAKDKQIACCSRVSHPPRNLQLSTFQTSFEITSNVTCGKELVSYNSVSTDCSQDNNNFQIKTNITHDIDPLLNIKILFKRRFTSRKPSLFNLIASDTNISYGNTFALDYKEKKKRVNIFIEGVGCDHTIKRVTKGCPYSHKFMRKIYIPRNTLFTNIQNLVLDPLINQLPLQTSSECLSCSSTSLASGASSEYFTASGTSLSLTCSHDSDFEPIYHEKQRGALCALHALNNLFQESGCFTVTELDEICFQLCPSYWFNPHRSLIGGGNYDINVIMLALACRGLDTIWFDKRLLPENLVFDKIMGFIMNVPSPETPWSLPILEPRGEVDRHWVTLKRISNFFYYLDSELENPMFIGRVRRIYIQVY